jgi:hypothetical protein
MPLRTARLPQEQPIRPPVVTKKGATHVESIFPMEWPLPLIRKVHVYRVAVDFNPQSHSRCKTTHGTTLYRHTVTNRQVTTGTTHQQRPFCRTSPTEGRPAFRGRIYRCYLHKWVKLGHMLRCRHDSLFYLTSSLLVIAWYSLSGCQAGKPNPVTQPVLPSVAATVPEPLSACEQARLFQNEASRSWHEKQALRARFLWKNADVYCPQHAQNDWQQRLELYLALDDRTHFQDWVQRAVPHANHAPWLAAVMERWQAHVSSSTSSRELFQQAKRELAHGNTAQSKLLQQQAVVRLEQEQKAELSFSFQSKRDQSYNPIWSADGQALAYTVEEPSLPGRQVAIMHGTDLGIQDQGAGFTDASVKNGRPSARFAAEYHLHDFDFQTNGKLIVPAYLQSLPPRSWPLLGMDTRFQSERLRIGIAQHTFQDTEYPFLIENKSFEVQRSLSAFRVPGQQASFAQTVTLTSVDFWDPRTRKRRFQFLPLGATKDNLKPLLRRLPLDKNYVNPIDVVFHFPSHRVAIAWDVGIVQLIDYAKGTILAEKASSPEIPLVKTMQFSSDGRWLIVPNSPTSLKIWDTKTQRNQVLDVQPCSPSFGVAFLPGQPSIAVGSQKAGIICTFPLDSSGTKKVINYQSVLQSPRFSCLIPGATSENRVIPATTSNPFLFHQEINGIPVYQWSGTPNVMPTYEGALGPLELSNQRMLIQTRFCSTENGASATEQELQVLLPNQAPITVPNLRVGFASSSSGWLMIYKDRKPQPFSLTTWNWVQPHWQSATHEENDLPWNDMAFPTEILATNQTGIPDWKQATPWKRFPYRHWFPSPNHRYLASLDDKHTGLELWDMETPSHPRLLRGLATAIDHAQVTEDRILLTFANHTQAVWELPHAPSSPKVPAAPVFQATGVRQPCEHIWNAHPTIHLLDPPTWSPGLGLSYFSQMDLVFQTRQLKSCKRISSAPFFAMFYQNFPEAVHPLPFPDNPRKLVLLSEKNTQLWQWNGEKSPPTLMAIPGALGDNGVLSKHGQLYLYQKSKARLVLWDIATRKVVKQKSFSQSVAPQRMQLIANEQRLVIVSQQAMQVIDLRTWQDVTIPFPKATEPPMFHPSGKFFLSNYRNHIELTAYPSRKRLLSLFSNPDAGTHAVWDARQRWQVFGNSKLLNSDMLCHVGTRSVPSELCTEAFHQPELLTTTVRAALLHEGL